MQVRGHKVLLVSSVIVLIATSYCVRAYADGVAPEITEREALQLARAVADHNRRPGSPYSYSIYKTTNPDFFRCCYQFAAYIHVPGSPAAPPLCYLAISKRTAAVWDFVREGWEDFAELRRLEAKIRRRHGITQTRDPELERALGYR